MTALRIFALSGSLRARSSNTELLRAFVLLAPPDSVDVYDGLATLPHFNPDDDTETSVLPPCVVDFRKRIAEAGVVLISSPEYAHGLPGALKNALDWLVSGPEMVGKPVAFIHTTDRAVHAPAQLLEVVRTMSARVVSLRRPVIPLNGKSLTAHEIVATETLAAMIRDALAEVNDATSAEPR